MKKLKQPTNLESFWRSRDRRPDLFTLNAEGNAQIPAVGDLPEKILPIPKYRPVNAEEIETQWAERESKFDPIYEQIETAKGELRAALGSYKGGTGTPLQVVRANQKVADLESQLIFIRSPERYLENMENPVTRDILFKDRYEVRKLGFNVYALKANPLTLQSHYKELTESERQTEEAIQKGELDAEQLFEVITDETVLGLHWPGDLVINGIKYFTAYQAILGEMAAESENQALVDSILGTRSVRTLRTLMKDLQAAQVKAGVLERVTDAALEQYAGFGDILIKTGDKQMVYGDPLDRVFGVGLDGQDPAIQQTKRWRGENLWGRALEAARTRFRERSVVGKPEDTLGGVESRIKRAAITEEEQEKAKTGAIINQRRFAKK